MSSLPSHQMSIDYILNSHTTALQFQSLVAPSLLFIDERASPNQNESAPREHGDVAADSSTPAAQQDIVQVPQYIDLLHEQTPGAAFDENIQERMLDGYQDSTQLLVQSPFDFWLTQSSVDAPWNAVGWVRKLNEATLPKGGLHPDDSNTNAKVNSTWSQESFTQDSEEEFQSEGGEDEARLRRASRLIPGDHFVRDLSMEIYKDASSNVLI